jgi:hypothetical protein
MVNISKIKACFEKIRFLIIADFGIPVSVRKWRDAIWVISDKGIKIIKELGPEIKILPL